ncbi:cation:proton antiporter [Sphingobium sp. RAC03]|uniref:cation:proton antiporter n=1 Tax=Sphingobium sp. RAC03 TaxID=1843368 RepID=UPI00083D3303|nr:cation:proton antiporter [Sphingobium sp. RAC03]AOF97045.1 sodium/hydrogen exchanger family protein [Sphingobium sp. RAC03]
MTITETFLLALALVMGLPWLVWRVLRTDNWAPLVVVQIVAGVLLGPGVLGVALPQVHDFLFPPGVIAALNGIAWWAVMIFVWLAGIELDLHQAWVARRETWTTAGLALVTPLVLGALAAALILTQPGWIGAKGQHWQALLGMGMACAVTALPILVLLMDRLTILRQPLGQRVLRYASLDDIAIWGVLALILLDWARVERQAGFLLLFPFVAWGLRAVMRRIGGRDRLYLGMLSLALLGFAADWAGLHFMVGAFLAGAILDKQWFDEAQMDMLRDHMLLTVMPVFFLSTGLRTQWDMGGFEVIGGALLLLAAAVVGKLAGVALAGRILGWPKGEAGVIGWLLQTKALIMIIFANILLDRQIITGTSFTALLLMAIGSTMLTMPMARRGLAKLVQR